MSMDPIHRGVLDNKTGAIMRRIGAPDLLAGLLKNVFTTSDIEEIKAKTNNIGATVGTQHLLSSLQKRGAKAFPSFIAILRSEHIKLEDLAEELLKEEQKLRRKSAADVPEDQVERLPTPVPEESPPPYTSPLHHFEVQYDFGNKALPIATRQQSIGETNQDNPQQTVTTLGPDTPIKDILYSTRSKIEQMLEPLDASRHDWRGMASVMNLTAAEVRDLENCGRGKMTALFDKMVQTKKTIGDLVGWLKHPDVQRFDAIEELENTGINCSSINDGSFDKDRYEDQDSADNMSPLSPKQESQASADISGNGKQDIRIPSQVEDDNSDAKGGHTLSQAKDSYDVYEANSSIKDARIPSQECGSGDFSSATYMSKEAVRFPSQVEQADSIDDDNDEVFSSTDEVKKNALLISCVNYKEHNIELENLEEVLEKSGWEVTIERKCKMSKLFQTVENFVKETERSACCFVYLIGTTINVIGNNYLLPADLKDVCCRADLIYYALNINQLVKRLSTTLVQVVIVDGVEDNDPVYLHYPGVLSGFASMSPPTNAVISSPCIQGAHRPDKDRLQYIRAVVKHASNPHISLVEFFEKVGRDASQDDHSRYPVVFSLNMPSFLPFCHTSSKQGIEMPSGKSHCHAIIFANSKYKGANFGITVYKEAESLRMTLLKAGWKCAVFCDEVSKSVMEKFRNTVFQLQDSSLKVVMLYFIGYAQKINDSNFFFGVDFPVGESPPTILDVRKSVPLQWALDLICEKVYGPKFLIVDDLNKCFNGGLAPMTAPQEVLISLPKSSGDGRVTDVSFTSTFTKLLEGNRGLSLKEAVVKASFVRHRINSKLFFA